MSGLLTTMAVVGGVLVVYHFLFRPRMLRWGATREEANRVLPGDEVTPPKPFRLTMAATLPGTPEEIWPWLVQMGWSRAGYYTYNPIENLFGLDLHNADRIHPEWQDLKVGETIWMGHPRMKNLFPETKTSTVEPNRALALAIYGPSGTDTPPTGAWTFFLEPIDDRKTRFIVRLQVAAPTAVGKIIFYAFMEPAHFIMQQTMFAGLRKRLARSKAGSGTGRIES